MKRIALLLAVVAACKSDPPATATAPAGSATTNSDPATTASRSGKIDLPNMKHRHSPDEHDFEPEDGKPMPNNEEMRQKFDEMRKAHESKLDTDGDGKISDDERKAARHERAEAMHARLDADGDGKLTSAELAASPRLSRRVGSDAAGLDANKDGNISVDELESALASRPQWGGGMDHFRNRTQGSGSGE